MPTVFDPQFDEKDKEQAQGGGGQTLADISGGSVGSGGPAPQTSAPHGSGSFVNLQNYLTANQGQSQAMADKVGGYVGDKAQQAQSGLDSVAKDFGSQVQRGTQTVDQSLVDRARNFALDDKGIKSLGNAYQQGYAGPAYQNWQDQSAAAKGAVDNAYDNIKATGDYQGEKALLGQVYGGPQYTRGLQSLDSALISRDQGAQQSLKGVRDKFANLKSYYDTASQGVQGQIDQAQKTSQATHDVYGNAIKQGGATLQGQLQKQADAMNTQRKGDYLSALTAAKTYDRDHPDGPHKVDYLKENAPVTGNQMMTADQAARLNALYGIIGQKPVSAAKPIDAAYTFDQQRWDADQPVAAAPSQQKITFGSSNEGASPISGITEPARNLQDEINKRIGIKLPNPKIG